MRFALIGRLLSCAAVSGCGYAWQVPANTENLNSSAAYMLERQDLPDKPAGDAGNAARGNAARCTAPAAMMPDLAHLPDGAGVEVLSPGDLIRVVMQGDDPPAGNYKVDSDGSITFALAGRVRATGRTVEQVETDLASRLVAAGIYKAGHAHVTVRLLERDAVRVMVAGAVFAPGQVTINERPQQPDTLRQAAFGDHAVGRSLSTALSHAAGVRPDADIAHVVVEHAGHRQVFDLSGFLDGSPVIDPLLVEGDRVTVPTRHCFQAALARPTPITPPGVRVYISNLTTPAQNNASSGIGRDQTNLPYGTRLLQALFSANCVGGAKVTNADRSAILVSFNPDTGESEVIERNIEAMIRRSDRDSYNPVVLPNDAIACYDSGVTNVREVMRSLGDLALTISVGRLIKP
jgi:polysaccharide export outer membrane protein